MVIPRSRSSGALSIESNARTATVGLSVDSPLVMAAVSVVLPWSMCPIVPMFTCGLLRSNFSFAISSSAPQIKIHSNLVNARCLLFAPVLLNDFFRQRRGQLRIMRKVHRERRAALRAAAQIRGVTEPLRQRNFHPNDIAPRAIFSALNGGTPGIQVAEDSGHVFFRHNHFH